jgi:tetratricopeptide (TPR) repeat protein
MEKNPAVRYPKAGDLGADPKRLNIELEMGTTRTQETEARSMPLIAVLAFANLGADKEREYFCDGMAEEIEKALELDPLSLIINATAGVVYVHTGCEDKAVEHAERILDMDPTFGFAHYIFAYVSERMGRYDEAVEGWLKEDSFAGLFNPQELAALRQAYASSGWAGYLRKRLRIPQPRPEQLRVPLCDIASLYVRLDDNEKAIKWLESAHQEHDHSLSDLARDHTFDMLRSDPRFVALLKRMGLEK